MGDSKLKMLSLKDLGLSPEGLKIHCEHILREKDRYIKERVYEAIEILYPSKKEKA